MLALAMLGGCLEAAEPAAHETTDAQDLSVFQWSAPTGIAHNTALYGPAIGALGNQGVYVYPSGFANVDPNYLEWIDFSGQFQPSSQHLLMNPRATTTSRPTLVGFGSYIYMFYASGADQYMARFDPAHRSWSGSTRLPFSSLGAPAVAVFGSSLVLVRVEPGTLHLVMQTMSPSEVFSAPSDILTNPGASEPCPLVISIPFPGGLGVSGSGATAAPEDSAAPQLLLNTNERTTTTPGLAVVGSCLYLAHRDGTTSSLVYNTFSGGRWGAQRPVTGGPGGVQQNASAQPALAAYQGVLHMVHIGMLPGPELFGADLQWSILSSGTWTAPLTVPNHGHTRGQPSLQAFPTRLSMVRMTQSFDDDGPTNIQFSTFQ